MTDTNYSDKCDILADFWITYKGDAEYSDFFEYNDLGLPMAYAISNGIVDSTPIAEGFISETFELLLASLGRKDEGFETLSEVLSE